jgi:radical SAM enzyme (TIGR01210 family)
MKGSLSNITQVIRSRYKPVFYDTTEPIRTWSEKDTIDDEVADAFVIILRTRGCSWGLKTNCTMCGYFTDTTMGADVSEQDLTAQFKKAMKHYHNEKILKIFTSGSFLDEQEIPGETRGYILDHIPDEVKMLSIESRPEHITDSSLDEMKKHQPDKDLEIGIGLETSDDKIRNDIINKGFTFNEYKRSACLVKKHGYRVKTYILVKPLFLTEREAIKDALKTVKDVEKYTTKISFNPVNVQRYTLVEYHWRRREYTPPWLWSVTEILKESKRIIKNNGKISLKCDPVGGGTRRGAHNCGACDQMILKSIREFTLTQDATVFNNLNCICKEQWRDQLELEGISFRSIIDTRINRCEEE